jgi:ATP-dependent Clp protease ATP-binding subunit ClpA
VKVPPPSEAEAVSILDGRARTLREFSPGPYTDEALQAAVYQSHRYIPDRFLPDKAIDVIDEAGARVKLRVRREQGNLADWNELNEWSRSYGDTSSLACIRRRCARLRGSDARRR